MGGKERGKHRTKNTETVTVEQGARNENEKEMEEVDLFDWFISRMGLVKPMEMEEDDLFDVCYFLVRANSSNIIPTTTTETSILGRRRLCPQQDFHQIDLVLEFITPHYFPSIINCVYTGTMLPFGDHQVYILGDHSEPLIQHNHNPIPLHEHTGASIISESHYCDWKPFDSPDIKGLSPDIKGLRVNPAVLSDKIYCFGFPSLYPQVYHPKTSPLWNPLPFPDSLVDKTVSFPLIPDPLNKRIIFHLPLVSKLYAFYPDENEAARQWIQLASNFTPWNCIAAAIADNILFFVPADVDHVFLFAYDMKTFTELSIVWDFSNIGDDFVPVYHAIFTLSNKGLMCLASGICRSSVQFLRFRVNRTSATHLKLTAIDYQKYDIPSATCISDIIFFRNQCFKQEIIDA